MIGHIDVQAILHQTVCQLYSDLVTRPTGLAVRRGIEQALADRLRAGTITVMVIDFSQVGLVDHSCADEIVAKLLLGAGERLAWTCPIVFRGFTESHLEAVEPVLEHQGLAILVQGAAGGIELVGSLRSAARRVFRAVCDGAEGLVEIATRAAVSEGEAADALGELLARRLLLPEPVAGAGAT